MDQHPQPEPDDDPHWMGRSFAWVDGDLDDDQDHDDD